MTGVLQSHARKYQQAIDALNFSFKVLPEYSPAKVASPPKDGVYVYGLFIDGARFDTQVRTGRRATMRHSRTRSSVFVFAIIPLAPVVSVR